MNTIKKWPQAKRGPTCRRLKKTRVCAPTAFGSRCRRARCPSSSKSGKWTIASETYVRCRGGNRRTVPQKSRTLDSVFQDVPYHKIDLHKEWNGRSCNNEEDDDAWPVRFDNISPLKPRPLAKAHAGVVRQFKTIHGQKVAIKSIDVINPFSWKPKRSDNVYWNRHDQLPSRVPPRASLPPETVCRRSTVLRLYGQGAHWAHGPFCLVFPLAGQAWVYVERVHMHGAL